MSKDKETKIVDKSDVSHEILPQDNSYKPVMFFAQSAKLLIGNPEAQSEEHFNSGQIAKEEAMIKFENHFFKAMTQQEHDVIMKLYPPQPDGKSNKLVMPVGNDYIAKFAKQEEAKKAALTGTWRKEETVTPDINEEEVLAQIDG